LPREALARHLRSGGHGRGTVSGAAFALALGAAFMHASWNVLLAGARDTEAATAVATLCGCALLLPVALATGGMSAAALPFAAASAVLHVGYLALLARAYRDGELGVVYPVSRGVAPVMVLVVAALVLGEEVGALGVVGVLLVAVGVLLVGVGRVSVDMRQKVDRPLSLHRNPHGRELLLGLAIATTIAAYTLVDAEGVDRAEPPAYLALMLTPAASVYAAGLAARGRATALRAELRPRAFLTGALVVGAYGSVLAALRLADAAPVAAVRESSVVIAALLAAAFLQERVDAGRLAGAALVLAGVATIAYS
jgi:drug/metabolite transporter (DMT)-like permease